MLLQKKKITQIFQRIAKKNYGTLGWFYGFKLHLVSNDKEQIINFLINVNDKYPLKNKNFTIKYLENM